MSGQRLFARLFQLGLLALALAWWFKDCLPPAEFYGPTPIQEPSQKATEAQAFSVRKGGENYRIKPLFDYDIKGMIVSQNEANSFGDIYHGKWKDHINLKDICIIWGDNLSSGVYQKVSFKNTTWTCWYQTSDGAAWRQFREDQISNNHLLADNPTLARSILKTQVGDLIRIKGYLAEYENLGNDFKRGTSITRTDTGNGACETIYVEDFQILQRANNGWHWLYRLSIWLVLASAGIWVFIIARSRPTRQN